MNDDNNIPIWKKRIRKLREDNQMTLKEVASKIGISEATAQRYESPNGLKNISYSKIEDYANVFNVSPNYIMGYEGMSIKQILSTEQHKPNEQRERELEQIDRLLGYIRFIAKYPIMQELIDAAQNCDEDQVNSVINMLKQFKKTNEDKDQSNSSDKMLQFYRNYDNDSQ